MEKCSKFSNLDNMLTLLEDNLLEMSRISSLKSNSIDSDLVFWIELNIRCSDALSRIEMIRKAFADYTLL